MRNRSKCCDADTIVGYHNPSGHGYGVVAYVATYCTYCEKMCSYYSDNKLYNHYGKIYDNQEIRRDKLEKINLLKNQTHHHQQY